MSIPPDRLLQLMERSNLATELLECQEEREALRRERNESREERDAACNLLQGIATALAKAVGAEECPPVTRGNIHAVVDECLGRVARLAHDREDRDRLKAVLLSKHGGEPLALLSELDEARAERDAARAEAEHFKGYEADLACIRKVLDEVDAPHDCEDGASLEPTRIRLLAEQLSTARAELAAERERFNLLSQRCDAAERERDAARIRGDDLAGRLAVAIVWRRSLARVCNDFIEAFDEHGVYDGLFYGSDSRLSALRAEVRSAQPTKSEVIAERDAARAEVEKLRGIKPTIRHGDGSKGTRFGIRWNGPQSPLAVPMDDGYWTPWHVAQAELAAVKRQRDELIRAKTGNNPDDYFCCNGLECGCQGVTVGEYVLHYVDRAIKAASQQAKRDWPEDAADSDNGNYQCRCVTCGESFTGHKRRVVCKACSQQPEVQP